MHRSLFLAASIILLLAVDRRTRVAGDPRGPRYGGAFDPLADARRR
jgi:hypothetical protein